jgi:hypothetical protein
MPAQAAALPSAAERDRLADGRRTLPPKSRGSAPSDHPAGTYAEYVAVTEDAPLAPVPDGLDPVAAAALPTAGGTGLALVELLGPLGGKTVLIVGAGGGVGSFATQFAVNAGARVTPRRALPGTAGSRPSPLTPPVRGRTERPRSGRPASRSTLRHGHADRRDLRGC